MLGNLTTRKVLLICLLIMLLTLVFKSVDQVPDLMSAKLPNPDSYTKLVLLRDYTPQTGFQYMARDNAPYGSYLHWSMVHSWVMLQLAHGLMFAGLPQDQALLWAGGSLTLLSMLLLAFFVALTVMHQGGRLAAIAGVFVLASSRGLMAYGQLLQITHHIFMLVPLAAATCCFLRGTAALQANSANGSGEGFGGVANITLNADASRARSLAIDGLGGAFLGLALWISPETMPFIVTLVAIRAAVRLQFPLQGPSWPTAAGLVGTLIWAWLLDPPPPTFSSWALDHISFAWLSLGLLLGALLLLSDALAARSLSLRTAAVTTTVAAGAAAAGWLFLVPGALAGPGGLIPAELKPIWWDKINELRHISTWSEAIAWLFMPALAGTFLLAAAWRKRCLWMALLSLSTLAYGILAAMHTRMGAAAALAAALSYGVALAQLAAFVSCRIPIGSLRRQWPAMVLILLPSSLAVTSIGVAVAFEAPTTKIDAAACSVEDISKRLETLPAGVVLAPVNSSPEILWRTHQSVVAGNYHHNTQGLLDLHRAWLSIEPDTQARQIMNSRGVNFVLACALGENRGDRAARTLLARVKAGQHIDWLSKQGAIDGWQLYFR